MSTIPKMCPGIPFGDLWEPVGNIAMEGGFLVDTVGKRTLTVYTTAYDEQAPAAVNGTRVERDSEGKCKIVWQPSTEPDFCYYRIYRSEDADFVPSPKTRIGSTTVTEFLDEETKVGREYHYRVIAVDQSGNARD